jgi:hypothetical protein
MISHTLTYAWKSANNSLPAKTDVIASDGEINVDIVVPSPTTDLAVAFAAARAKMQDIFLVSNFAVTLKTNSPGISAVIALAMSGGATGGTFAMTGTRPDTLAVATATGIPFNATRTQAQTASDTVYGAGNTLVSGTGFPYAIAFQGDLADYPVALPTFDNSGLTGGTLPGAGGAAASTTTAGVRWNDRYDLLPGIPIAWSINSYHDNPFTADLADLYFSNSSGQQATVNIRIGKNN